MKRKFNRALSFILAFLLTFSSVDLSVLAQTAETDRIAAGEWQEPGTSEDSLDAGETRIADVSGGDVSEGLSEGDGREDRAETLTVETDTSKKPSAAFTYETAVGGYTIYLEAGNSVLPEGTEASVNQIPSDSVQAIVAEQMEDSWTLKLLDVFEISLWSEGVEVEPAEGESVFVSICPSQTLKDACGELERWEIRVLHIDDEGNAEWMDIYLEDDDDICFDADAFSKYAIVLLDTVLSDGGDAQRPPLTYQSMPGDGDYESIKEHLNIMPMAVKGTLPSSYTLDDIRSYLPKTRDQNPYGSCWAHSVMALAEIGLAKNQGYKPTEVDLSELQLAYFMYNTPETDPLGLVSGDRNSLVGDQDFMNRGGNVDLAKKVLQGWICAGEDKGELAYSNASNAITYGLRDELAYDNKFHLKNYYNVNMGERDEVKQAVYDYGAVAVSYYDHNAYRNGNYGKNSSFYCDENYTANHAVVIVGWDDNFSAENFKTTPEGNGAWLIRNSWTVAETPSSAITSASSYTYFWMSYYDKSLTGGVAMEFEEADKYDNNYHYDASAYDVHSIYPSGSKQANVFTAKAGSSAEILEAVAFETRSANVDYTITVYTDLTDSSNPESGTPASVVQGTTSYGGYYTIPLTDYVPLKAGDVFSVVLELSRADGSSVYVLRETSVTFSWIAFEASSKPGESFCKSPSGVWTDCGKSGNLRIKAFTVNAGEAVEATGISFAESEIDLSCGESCRLVASVTPNNALDKRVIWSTSDATVVSVSNGTITANDVGEATITAALAGNPNISATCKVKVSPSLKITGAQYDNTNETVDLLGVILGRSFTFSTQTLPEGALPDQKLEWSSSNPSVVTVTEDGKATAKGKGSAQICVYDPEADLFDSVVVTVDRLDYSLPSHEISEDNQSVTISWSKIAGAHHYKLYFGKSNETLTEYVTENTSYVVGGLQEGATYAYRFFAFNEDESLQSLVYYPRFFTVTPPHKVTYVLDGGVNDSRNPAIAREGMDYYLYYPTKTGYTFYGWYKDSAFQSRISYISSDNKKDLTIYARWTPNMYYVYYDGNGSTGGTMSYSVMTYDTASTLKKVAYTKKGCKFLGWNTQPDGKGKTYKDQQSVKNLATEYGAEVTLYAMWDTIPYTVSFDLCGGEGEYDPLSVKEGEAFGELPVPERYGYDFEGWYTLKEGGEVKTESSKLTKAADEVLYAHWKAKTFRIYFNAKGGSGEADFLDVVFDQAYGEIPSPTRTGYTFAGWSYTKDDIETVVNETSLVKYAGNHTLFAKWTANRYDLVFVTQYGEAPTSVKVTYDEPYGELPEPLFAGGEFLGWYSEPNGGEKITPDLPVQITEPQTLYAHWNLKYTAETPVPSIADGSEVKAGTKLYLTSETDGAAIYYTTNGADPRTSPARILYEDAIVIEEEVMIRAASVKFGYNDSDVLEVIYTVIDESGDWGDVDLKDKEEKEFIATEDIPNALWAAGVPEAVDYTGKAITFADFHVYNYKTLLKPGTDYTVKYSNNTKAGTATITVTGKGNYAGTIKETFQICPLDISEAKASDIWLAYNGKVQKGTTTVTYDLNGSLVTLKSGTDFTYEYPQTNSKAADYSKDAFKQAGKYTIKIVGKGNYTGELTVTETITATQVPIGKAAVAAIPNQVYTGNMVCPCERMKLTYGGKVLKGILIDDYEDLSSEDKEKYDYVYSFSNNLQLGTATVRIEGVNTYIGERTATFKIVTRKFTSAKFNNALSANYAWTGSPVEPLDPYGSVTYTEKNVTEKLTGISRAAYEEKLENGESLAGYDYVYEYGRDTINVGTVSIKMTGINGYSGSKTVNYTISVKDLSSAQFKGVLTSSKPWTGDPIEPVTEGTVTYTEKGVTEVLKGISKAEYAEKLKTGDEKGYDFAYEYIGDTVNVGTVKIVLTGINGYSGSKTLSYKITGKNNFSNVKLNGLTSSFTWEEDGDFKQTITEKTVSYPVGKKYEFLEGIERSEYDQIQDAETRKGYKYVYEYVGDLSSAGTVKIVFTGINGYSGTKNYSYKVTGKDFSKATISGLPTKCVCEAGKARRPEISEGTVTYTENGEKRNLRGIEKNAYQALLSANSDERKNYDYTYEYFADDYSAGAVKIVFTGINSFEGTKTHNYTITGTKISDAKVNGIKKSYVGDGTPQEPVDPDKTLTYGSTELKGILKSEYDQIQDAETRKGYEYVYEYLGDTRNDGTVKVVFTGVNRYMGTKTVSYEIKKYDITAAKFNGALTASYAWTGTPVEPLDAESSVTYTINKKTSELKGIGKAEYEQKLANGESLSEYDYIYEYVGNTVNVGTVKIRITGINCYTGSKTLSYKIGVRALSGAKFADALTASRIWTGDEIRPVDGSSVTYTANNVKTELRGIEKAEYDQKLANGDPLLAYDYVYEYVGSTVDYGTVKIVFMGINGYTGTVSKSYKIVAQSIDKLSVAGVDSGYVYTGSEIQPAGTAGGANDVSPEFKVYVKATKTAPEKVLVKGTDYVVSYQNNVKTGTATIIFTGVGAYSGTLKKTFKINAYSIAGSNNVTVADIGTDGTVAYEKDGCKPTVVVTDPRTGTVLKQGTDYTLSYANNTTVTKDGAVKVPVVTITGKGNYTGKKTKNFTICASTLDYTTIASGNVVYQNKANICKPAITLTDKNGAKLKAGTDYESSISYKYVMDTKVKVAKKVNGKTVYEEPIRSENAPVQTTDIIPAGTQIWATVTGKGYYADSKKTVIFKYVTADMAKATVSVTTQTYTGDAVEPTKDDIKVTLEGKVLGKSDYEIVGYSNNVTQGTGKVTLKGVGNYGGTKTVNFKITSRSMNYTITYDKNANDATGTMKASSTVVGAKLTLNAYKRKGYAFNGWNTKADGTGVSYKDQEAFRIKDIRQVFGTKETLYAQWSPISYNITYNLNGGANSGSNPAKYTVENEIVLEKPTKEGYTFDGWYLDNKFTKSKKVEKINVGSTGNKVFYAKWIKNKQ